MFLVNSRYRHFSAAHFGSIRSDESKVFHLTWAHLLPKLRCYFAEFLNQGSLKRLGILSPPTCVGLRYDHLVVSLEAFLDSMGSITLLRKAHRHHLSALKERTDLPVLSAYGLKPPSNRRLTYPSVSPHHSDDNLVVQEY